MFDRRLRRNQWRASAAILSTLAGVAFGGAIPAAAQETGRSVARIAYIEGQDVAYARGDDPDKWQDAALNVPLTQADSLYTGDGSRAELQLHGNNRIFLSPQTDLQALTLGLDHEQFALREGICSFKIANLGEDELVEICTPNATVLLNEPGEYRIETDREKNTLVTVRSGQANVAAGGGKIDIDGGKQIGVYGSDSPEYEITDAPARDAQDEWVAKRLRSGESRSRRYVDASIAGAEDLDESGEWREVQGYGWGWTPRRVAAGWQPYQDGRWVWQDPWGWTWVANEHWGWAPYHYGRWMNTPSGWYWIPDAVGIFSVYSPALVAFAGSSPDFVIANGVYVGWFPLGPGEAYSRSRVDVHQTVYNETTRVTYVNQNYITVVNNQTFVGGGAIRGKFVHDQAVIKKMRTATAVVGPVPLAPEKSALSVSEPKAGRKVSRPDQATRSREVVTRMAPAPAPASFAAKQEVIKKNKGRPVMEEDEAKLTSSATAKPGIQEAPGVPRIAAGQGEVRLKARNSAAAAVEVRPLAADDTGRNRIKAERQAVRAEQEHRGPPNEGQAVQPRQSPAGETGEPGHAARRKFGEAAPGAPAPPSLGHATSGATADLERERLRKEQMEQRHAGGAAGVQPVPTGPGGVSPPAPHQSQAGRSEVERERQTQTNREPKAPPQPPQPPQPTARPPAPKPEARPPAPQPAVRPPAQQPATPPPAPPPGIQKKKDEKKKKNDEKDK